MLVTTSERQAATPLITQLALSDQSTCIIKLYRRYSPNIFKRFEHRSLDREFTPSTIRPRPLLNIERNFNSVDIYVIIMFA